MCACIYLYTHARMPARTHAHIHARIDTYTHTHTDLLEAGWRQMEVLGVTDRELILMGT